MVWLDRQNILCKQRACLGNTVCRDELRFNEMSEGINNSVPFSGVMGAGFSAGHKTKWREGNDAETSNVWPFGLEMQCEQGLKSGPFTSTTNIKITTSKAFPEGGCL